MRFLFSILMFPLYASIMIILKNINYNFQLSSFAYIIRMEEDKLILILDQEIFVIHFRCFIKKNIEIAYVNSQLIKYRYCFMSVLLNWYWDADGKRQAHRCRDTDLTIMIDTFNKIKYSYGNSLKIYRPLTVSFIN